MQQANSPVSTVIFRDDHRRLLTIREKNTSLWTLPSGRPQLGETLYATAVRIAHEELEVHIREEQLIFLGDSATSSAFLYQGNITPHLTDCKTEISWIAPHNPKDNLDPVVKQEILPYFNDTPIHSVAVFAGSTEGNNPDYKDLARCLGSELATAHLRFVYGGRGAGLMGIAADACLLHQGHVTGVMPRHLVDAGKASQHLTNLEVVQTMHERKARMGELVDAFICLPGGIGTLDEFFDMWTHRQLGLHHKPIALLGRAYWEPTVQMLDHMVTQGFIRPEDRQSLIIADTASEVVEALRAWQPTYPLEESAASTTRTS